MKTLTYEQAVELAGKNVEKQGADYVYPIAADIYGNEGCHYFRKGTPSCLVGRILADVGVTEDEIGNNEGAQAVLFRLEYSEILETDTKTRDFLMCLQTWQDNGTPWGESLRNALKDVDEAATEGAYNR